jgi:hypothetical protein
VPSFFYSFPSKALNTMPTAVGTLIVMSGGVSFTGLDAEQQVPISATGSISPQVPSPGVNDTAAILTCDSLETLPGSYDIVASESYAGREAAVLHFKRGQGAAELQTKVNSICDISNRTVLNSGSIKFSVVSG